MPRGTSRLPGTPWTRGSRRTSRFTGTRATRITVSIASAPAVGLRVEAAGITLVDTAETLAVYETALEPRLYVDPRLVQMEHLRRTATETYCSYKGTATYWSAHIGNLVIDDIAWSYESPLSESSPLRHFMSFDESKVTVVHDLPLPG